MTKDPRVYLVQILERAERIRQFTEGGKVAFFGSRLIQDAVIRPYGDISRRPQSNKPGVVSPNAALRPPARAPQHDPKWQGG
jgi:hypothetical protein